MDRRQGQWVYYRLHPSLPEWVGTMLNSAVDANQDWLNTDAMRLAEMGGRPQNTAACV